MIPNTLKTFFQNESGKNMKNINEKINVSHLFLSKWKEKSNLEHDNSWSLYNFH